VSDRIEVWWQSEDDDLRAAVAAHAPAIVAEVLAQSLDEGPGPIDAAPVTTDLAIRLALRRVALR
jgi:hypothetical protein